VGGLVGGGIRSFYRCLYGLEEKVKGSTRIIMVCLVVANLALLWKNNDLKGIITATSAMAADSNMAVDSNLAADTVWPDVTEMDLQGVYAYLGFGKAMAPTARGSETKNPPMTLAIFFSAKTQCSLTLSEMGVYRKLLPILRSRGQAMIAVTMMSDSVTIDSLLKKENLLIPIGAMEKTDQGIDFDKMGLSAHFMPFKVVYDSAFDAIYMRTGDNSPETQASFERAVLKLSGLVAEGKL
jgi:hypothetical protein